MNRDYINQSYSPSTIAAADKWLCEVQRHIETFGKVLDIGCGAGNLCYLLEEKQIDVYGGEIRTDFLHEFQKRIRGTRAIQLDAAELPCKSAVFDTVFSMVVLNYVRRERKAWFEMARVLRQGGYARLRVSGISRIYEILKTASLSHRIIVAGLILASTLAALCCGFRYKPFWSHTFHTRRSLIRIARTCGFDIIFLNDQDNGRMYDLLLRKI